MLVLVLVLRKWHVDLRHAFGYTCGMEDNGLELWIELG